ncbi:MAG: hypothetical protein EA355_01545 [Rhodobacteraceae bacterium]|nr:MAG: hypothetical protein EA355_01545 [Paracoccaceae bacterium]
MRWLRALGVAAAAAACGGGEGATPASAPAPLAETAAPRLPLARVSAVEIGRLADGLALTVFGEPPAAGWTRATLEPRGGGLGPDGWLAFDLVASPPREPSAAPLRPLRADALIPAAALAGAQGLRVHAAGGAAEIVF